MALIQVSHLTFGYDGSMENLFDDVSFQLDTDWKLGLTGRNGRGKTTLLNLLRGMFPYRGRISSPVLFDYFPFEVPDRTRSAHEVVLTHVPEAEDWRLAREMSLLDLLAEILDRPYETLSPGEQGKLLLAALFLRPGRFLLIDEPTNHLDEAARRKVSEYLDGKRGYILVSHDRRFLDGCVDHILSITKTRIEVQKGNYSTWLENKERRDRFEQAENDRLKREIGQLTAAARQTAAWSDRTEHSKYRNENLAGKLDRGYIGHKASKMMKRSKAIVRRREQAAEEKSALLKDIERVDRLMLRPLEAPKPVLVEASGLSIRYDGRPVFEGLDFTLSRGERIAVCGRNGCGKSSLLRLVAGEPVPHDGKLLVAGGLILSRVPQDTSALHGRLSDFARDSGVDESLFRIVLDKLDVRKSHWDADMRDFSEGQKKKVLLARSLSESAHLYLWDEPLNYIDILSRGQVEELILECSPTMLLVEHDSAFIDAVATRRLVIG